MLPLNFYSYFLIFYSNCAINLWIYKKDVLFENSNLKFDEWKISGSMCALKNCHHGHVDNFDFILDTV